MEPSSGSSSRAPSEPNVDSSINETGSARITVTVSHLRSLIDDKFYQDCKRHFLMVGKGRRPDLPILETLTQRVLIQLHFLKDDAKSSFRELKLWLEKLDQSICHVTEGRVKHRVLSALQSCLKMTEEDVLHFLSESVDFHAAPPALADLNLDRLHLTNLKTFNQPATEYITNRVVIALEHFKSSERNMKFSTVKWLKTLSTHCSQINDSLLTSKLVATMKKYKVLNNLKKVSDLEEFLKEKFLAENVCSLTSVELNSENNETKTNQLCSQCEKLKTSLKQEEVEKKKLLKEIQACNTRQDNFTKELHEKTNILEEVQREKLELEATTAEAKTLVSSLKRDLRELASINKNLEEKVRLVTDTKLYYQRNVASNKEIERLNNQITEIAEENSRLKKQLQSEQECTQTLKYKVRNEQQMKSKFKKERDVAKDQVERCMYSLNNIEDDKELNLKEKFNAYSNNIRELYMSLQGETSIVPAQTSKAVHLVAKHLFNKNIPLQSLPCRKTSLNFMDEAHHIAKQQIVDTIKEADHFTFASDGTSRQKRHYMEHHLILNSGGTLSVGFTEVPDDKAETLLKKSLALIEELSETYCEAQETAEKDEIFKEILSKMLCLMSDRAANMKLYNKKMLEHKKQILGSDAAIQFLHCNAHFLIALADSTDAAVKDQESLMDEKLGRDKQNTFNRFANAAEPAVLRVIRTTSDVLGPRGDEKNGCREEWLAHCNLRNFKSLFTTYRSNRFNNVFENAVAILAHKDEYLHFLQHCIGHSNLKLQSICFDLQDKQLVSLVAAVALFSTYLATPYWNLMNSNTSYGDFPMHVRAMHAALQRWSQDDYKLSSLPREEPLFGRVFALESEVAFSFVNSESCHIDLSTATFKAICVKSLEALGRQLIDFLPGGVYGGDIPEDVRKLLTTCPLTNLTGERLFGDLDYSMIKRRTASTFLHSTINMWKHNKTSDFLSHKSPKARNKLIESAKKNGKKLKQKHKAMVKETREAVKQKLQDCERKKEEKDIQDKDRQVALLTDLISQGGLCHTKEDLDSLMAGPQPLQKIKIEMRFRKYYLNATDLRLTGNLRTLYTNLCSFMGFEYEITEPPQKKRKREQEDSAHEDEVAFEEEVSVDEDEVPFEEEEEASVDEDEVPFEEEEEASVEGDEVPFEEEEEASVEEEEEASVEEDEVTFEEEEDSPGN